MKKFGMIVAGGIAAIVLLANLGSMVGLVISLAILYYVARKFLKSDSTGKKILWGIIGLIVLSTTVSNVPALFGIIAAIVLYLVYKNWNKTKEYSKEEDPFLNFEKEWAKLK